MGNAFRLFGYKIIRIIRANMRSAMYRTPVENHRARKVKKHVLIENGHNRKGFGIKSERDSA